MYKIRIILMSALFLLLVGMDMNVRAGIDSSKLVQDAKSNDQSEKESKDGETKEIITDLDFFGAFSLVNVQLQWRDLTSGLNQKVKDTDVFINRIELLLETQTSSSDDNEQLAPSSATITPSESVFAARTFRTLDGKAHFNCNQNAQQVSTIAYILNCGTYPKSS